jgi:23S rRNA pseudouridine2605 synthase
VDGRPVTDPRWPVVPERARIAIDGRQRARPPRRTIVFHKPRGVVTTRRDPQQRPTVYDAIGSAARGLMPVGRLDVASSGLLILTNDTRLAHAILDPAAGLPRLYAVTVRGEVTPAEVRVLRDGVMSGGERLSLASVTVRKTSRRESHVLVELREGKNREVRRLFAAIGHEVTRLKRVGFGTLALGDLAPGEWRELSSEEIATSLVPGRRR